MKIEQLETGEHGTAAEIDFVYLVIDWIKVNYVYTGEFALIGSRTKGHRVSRKGIGGALPLWPSEKVEAVWRYLNDLARKRDLCAGQLWELVESLPEETISGSADRGSVVDALRDGSAMADFDLLLGSAPGSWYISCFHDEVFPRGTGVSLDIFFQRGRKIISPEGDHMHRFGNSFVTSKYLN